MASATPTAERGEYDHLPLTTHTTVLGVDITVNQRAEAAAADGKRTEGGLGPGPRFETLADRDIPRVRRGLAAWARRNLFGGRP